MNIFDRLVEFMDRGEHSFVTFLSKLIPLLVPLLPAYVSYSHVVAELKFHWLFGVTYGLVVEGLGYAAIYKAVQFWEWNRHYTKEENQMPFGLVISIYVSYLLVILWVNVMLDWQSGVEWFRVIAVALISLLSVPAGLLLSVSAIHTERTFQREQRKNERKEQVRTSSERTANNRTNRKRTANDVRQGIKNFIANEQASEQRTPGPTEISRSLNVSKGYAHEVLQEYLRENPEETYLQ